MAIDSWNLPWCLGGDFNKVIRLYEGENCVSITSDMREFSQFIGENELIDLPMSGSRFTWSRQGSNAIKMDRFLIFDDFDLHYATLAASVLGKPLSDRFPIRFSYEMEGWRAPSWRFEDMWLQGTNILELMRQWLTSSNFNGSVGYVLAKKLLAFKFNLKEWNKTFFGRIDLQSEGLVREIKGLEALHPLLETQLATELYAIFSHNGV